MCKGVLPSPFYWVSRWGTEKLNNFVVRFLCEDGFGLCLVHPMKAAGLRTLNAGSEVSKVGWWECHHV